MKLTTRAASVPREPFVGTIRRFKSRRDSLPGRDVGLLVARFGLAWVFIYHGSETLFGAFHGLGLHRTAVYFASTAHLRPGMLFAVVNGIVEFFGGIAVGLGVLSRLAGVALVGDMVVAMITVTFHNGFTSSASGTGYELNVALATLAAAVALAGPGRLALDALFPRTTSMRT